jgi:hypothetical protein
VRVTLWRVWRNPSVAGVNPGNFYPNFQETWQSEAAGSIPGRSGLFRQVVVQQCGSQGCCARMPVSHPLCEGRRDTDSELGRMPGAIVRVTLWRVWRNPSVAGVNPGNFYPNFQETWQSEAAGSRVTGGRAPINKKWTSGKMSMFVSHTRHQALAEAVAGSQKKRAKREGSQGAVPP